jgi:hypothetical protein
MRRIYNIAGGMGSIGFARFALLRASPAGSKEGSFFAFYGTAKAVP